MYNRHIIEVVTDNENVVFGTVLSGVLVFVTGQILQKFLFEPIKEYKAVVGKIDNELKYHENILLNDLPSVIVGESLLVTRRLSCDLESSYKQIPFSKFIALMKLIPDKKSVSNAATKIIRLSNVGGQGKFVDRLVEDLNDIRNNLNIPKL